MENKTQAISKFSDSICRKIPAIRQISTKNNALWILRNPVRLTTLEKQEVLAVALKGEQQCK